MERSTAGPLRWMLGATVAPSSDDVSRLQILVPRILVVDDTDDVRELYAERLAVEGYEVIQAAHGGEAIDASFAKAPVLIIMDLDMPVVDGLTAIRVLKSDPRTKDVPIIVVTGTVMRHKILAALEAGAAAILPKPSTLGMVLAAVAHALRGDPVCDEVRSP